MPLSRIRLLMKIPRRFRLPYIQKMLITEGFRLLCLLKGDKFSYPVLPSEEGSYIVTESIPSLRLTLFGKTIWYTDSIPFGYVRCPRDLEAQRELVDKVVARTKGPIHYVAIFRCAESFNGGCQDVSNARKARSIGGEA